MRVDWKMHWEGKFELVLGVFGLDDTVFKLSFSHDFGGVSVVIERNLINILFK